MARYCTTGRFGRYINTCAFHTNINSYLGTNRHWHPYPVNGNAHCADGNPHSPNPNLHPNLHPHPRSATRRT